jgi:C-terminal processing protease CtpA/Prc
MVRVDKVYEGTLAARAGIAINDVITMIDGVPLQGMDKPDILARLRSAIGTDEPADPCFCTLYWRTLLGR